MVPQAALVSKIQRGKNLQYHAQLSRKDGAEDIYNAFVHELREVSQAMAQDGSTCAPAIMAGTFGNRQEIKITSLGPFTHTFEL